MKPCTEAQVRELEEHFQLKLPQAYVGYLRGEYELGRIITEHPYSFPDCGELRGYRAKAEALLAQHPGAFALAANDFVFELAPEHEFLYFRCEPGEEDPPVFCFHRGDVAPERLCEHFSEWVQGLQVEDEPGMLSSEGTAMPERFPCDISEFLTPALQAELQRIESPFRAQLAQIHQYLGWPLGAFSPSLPNLIAGLILGLLFAMLGVAVFGFGVYQAPQIHFQMPWVAPGGLSWMTFLLMSVLSTGMAVVGVWLIWRAKRLFGSRLVVAAHGLAWARSSGCEMFAWQDIRAVEEIVVRESLPIRTVLRYLFPKSNSRQFVVHTKDNREFRFTPSMLRDLDTLRAMLERIATDLQLPWSVLEGTC